MSVDNAIFNAWFSGYCNCSSLLQYRLFDQLAKIIITKCCIYLR